MLRRLALALLCTALATGGLWAHWPDAPLPPGATADRVRVDKGARRLTLLRDGQALKTYRVALGRNPEGRKMEEGDHRTPEGVYAIDRRNAQSRFHRALHISYPSPAEVARAQARGVSPGGDIMIHGLRNGLGWLGKLHRLLDWTNGCVAVTDMEMDELWRAVPDGSPVEILP